MDDLTSLLQIAALSTIAIMLTTAMTDFGRRVVREATATGRADRRAVWRLVTMKVLIVILAVCGLVVVAVASLLLIVSLSDSPRFTVFSVGQAHFVGWLSVAALLVFGATSWILYRLVEPIEVVRASRSYVALRQVRTRGRIAWIRWRRRTIRGGDLR